MCTLESYSHLLFLAKEKIQNRRWLYLDDYLDKLLESSFSPKYLFLSFRKDMESLSEMLLRGGFPF
jgi:hypothetical protein